MIRKNATRARGCAVSKRRHWRLALLALALLLAACGGDDEASTAASDDTDAAVETEDTETEEETPTTTADTTTTTAESTTTTEAAIEEPEADESAASTGVETSEIEPFTVEQRDAGLNQVDALGGLEFELAEATTVIAGGNCVFIQLPGYTGASPFPPALLLGLIVSTGMPPVDLEPISTIEEWLALYGDEPAPRPTGETVTFLDEELAGYEIAGAFPDGPPPAESFLNCGSAPGIASEAAFLNAPFGTDFVAETPDGLLFVGFGGFTPDEAALGGELFDQVLPTLARQ